jgi:RimJ/RimL family protein N-acetyltransferase
MRSLHIWANANPLISKIDLRVRLSNRRAIQLYESLGYQVEGWIRRAVKIDGQYDDHYWMGKEFPH